MRLTVKLHDLYYKKYEIMLVSVGGFFLMLLLCIVVKIHHNASLIPWPTHEDVILSFVG